MQAIQVRATEIRSAGVAPKINDEVGRAAAQEKFGVTLHREIDASGLSRPATREAGSSEASNQEKANQGEPEKPSSTQEVMKSNVPPLEEVPNKADADLNLVDADLNLVDVGPQAVAKVDIRPKTALEAHGDGGSHVTPKGSLEVKHAVEALGPGHTESTKPQAEVVPVASLIAASGVAEGVPIAANQISVSHEPAECSPAMKVASSMMKRDRAVGPATKDAFSKPVQSAENGYAVTSGKDGTITAPESRTKLEKGKTAASSFEGTCGGHGNIEAMPAAQAGLHFGPAETMGRGAPIITANHPANSSAGTEVQLQAATAMGGGEVEGKRLPALEAVQLDVGVFDGTHGWLRIRAELGTEGGVSASLTAASASAHESLRAALPEMAVYLRLEAVRVHSISVHQSADCSDVMTAGQGQQEGGDRRQQSGDGLPDHSGAMRRNFAQVTDEVAVAATRTSSYSWIGSPTGSTTDFNARAGGAPGVMSGFEVSSWYPGGGTGSWLNVCA